MTTKKVSRLQSRHLSERVVHFFKLIVDVEVTETVRQFAAEGFSAKTLYKIINWFRYRDSDACLPKTCRP